MKKIFTLLYSVAVVAAIPFVVFAANFDHDISYGTRHDPEVTSLQEFLTKNGSYQGPLTGNFFSLTRQALIDFQKKEGITPASGYFGSKTRAKINMLVGTTVLSREEIIASLRAQIEALQTKIADLLAKAALEKQALATPAPAATAPLLPSPSPSPFPSPISSPTPSPIFTPAPTPVPVAELRISGNVTQSFPDTVGLPLKLGDITIKNTTDHPILFNQFQLDIYDAMNSSVNRNKTVLFKLRNGTTTAHDLISETPFTINREPPPNGTEANRRQLDVSFPITIKAGETKVTSLWIENLDYVINGSLRIEMLTAYISDGLTPQGNFTFILTKQ